MQIATTFYSKPPPVPHFELLSMYHFVDEKTDLMNHSYKIQSNQLKGYPPQQEKNWLKKIDKLFRKHLPTLKPPFHTIFIADEVDSQVIIFQCLYENLVYDD